MTYEDWIIAVATEAPRRSGSALKLLLHLASTSIQTGSNQVRASDRELETQLDICRPALTEAKRNLADLIRIESRKGVPSVFSLPADWFPGQRSLFPQPVARFPSHQWPGNMATTGQENRPSLASFSSQSGQESRPPGQENRPLLASNSGHSGQESRPPGQESEPRPTGNQQDADGLSRSRSISEVRKDSREYVLSILSMRVLPPEKRPEATVLAGQLQHVLHQLGNVAAAQTPPDDAVLTQCLAIAPLRELLPILDLAKQRRGRPKGYRWFVTVFLENIAGIPREATGQVVEEMRQMRQRKQPGRAEPLPFPAEMVQQAVNQVKKLR